MDGSISDPIILRVCGAEIFVSGKRALRNILKSYNQLIKLALELIRFKLLLFIPLNLGKPGDGFHSGAFLQAGEDVDSLGRIAANVHIIDSSVLQELYPGSITPTIMLNSARIVRSTYSE
jgi:hypothetical protein